MALISCPNIKTDKLGTELICKKYGDITVSTCYFCPCVDEETAEQVRNKLCITEEERVKMMN